MRITVYSILMTRVVCGDNCEQRIVGNKDNLREAEKYCKQCAIDTAEEYAVKYDKPRFARLYTVKIDSDETLEFSVVHNELNLSFS